MPEETEKTATNGRVLSLKVTSKTYDEFQQLRTEGQYPTAQLFMQELLERYSDPIVANKNNDELKAKLEELQAENEKLKEANIDLAKRMDDAGQLNQQEIERLKADITNYQQSEEHDRMEKEQTSKSHILVPISPLERKCLEYLTERERKNRRRTDITPPVFFMYVLSEMLIKGNKFSINCVPDSVIAKFEKELKDEE
ncbi:MAG: hypothetical protein MJZ72_07085 [Bacteroidales bacterium]|nr:hypothetical protein [Bacteroidales bacterium]